MHKGLLSLDLVFTNAFAQAGQLQDLTDFTKGLPYFANLMRTKTAIEIYYSADIGPRFNIGHGAGLVIGPGHVIGSDFVAYDGVTLGQRHPRHPRETIIVGNHCKVCTGAKVLGQVRIGDHVRVAANAVLLTDAEAYCTYAGVPAVKVASRPSVPTPP